MQLATLITLKCVVPRRWMHVRCCGAYLQGFLYALGHSGRLNSSLLPLFLFPAPQRSWPLTRALKSDATGASACNWWFFFLLINTDTHTHTLSHSLGSWAWHLGVVPSLFRGTVPPQSYICLHGYDFLLVHFGGWEIGECINLNHSFYKWFIVY